MTTRVPPRPEDGEDHPFVRGDAPRDAAVPSGLMSGLPGPAGPARQLHRADSAGDEVPPRQSQERLLALHEATVRLAAQTDPTVALATVLHSAGMLLGASSATFYRWDPAAGLLRCAHNWQVPARDTTPDQRPGEGLAGHAFLLGAPFLINDYLGWAQAMESGRAAGLRAALAVPLTRAGQVLGVIVMRAYDETVTFTTDDARLLTLFAGQAAAALENARLHDEARRQLAERVRAETALIASEARYRTLVEQASDGIFVMDTAGRFLEANARACAMLGYTREELLQLHSPDTIDPADLAARPLVVPVSGADPIVFERLLRRKDGTTFPAEASVKRLPDGRTQSILRDITERTAAVAAVRASEARYRQLFAEAERQARELALLDRVRTALAAQLDEHAITRTVADALAEDLGYTRQGLFLCDGDRLVGETRIGRSYQPFTIPLTAGMMGRVARTGRGELVTDVARDPDFISARGASGAAIAVPLRDGDDLLGILNVESESAATLGETDLHLLTALAEQVGIALGRARRHAALRRSEVGLAEAQRLAGIGSWEYDIDADRLTWSDEIFRILGHAPRSFIPTQERLLAAIHPADRAHVTRARADGSAGDGRYDVEHRIVRPDGTVRMAHQRTEIVRDSAGRPIKRQGVIQDVTERRALEAALRLQNAHLAALGETGRALSGELDLDRALDLAWAQIARVSGVADGWIALVDAAADTLNYRDFVLDGVRRPEWEVGQPRAAGGLGWAVIDAGAPLRVPDYAAECRRRGVPTNGPLGDTPGITWLGLPLVAGGQIVGALAVWRATGPFADGEEATLATLAGQVAAALANARLYAAVRLELAERVRAEEALRASEASLAAAQALAHLGNWELDLTTGMSRWSAETFRIFGLDPGVVAPSDAAFLAAIHPDDLARVGREASEAAATLRPRDHEYRIVRPGGEIRVVHDRSNVIFDGDGRPLRRLGAVLDITERKALEGRLAHQATHDTLTGLPNRALLLDRLGQALARARRDGRPCVVLFVDLDRFKDVNDTLGHDAGDRLLVTVAARLRDGLRDNDTLARLGGDEFAVLLEGSDAGAATRTADRILATLAQPLALDGHVYRLTASVGIAPGRPEHLRPEETLRDADIALYRAKDAGRAGYALFDPAMQAQLVARLELERDLRDALERDEFVLYYQPLVALTDGRIVGVEALVRWRHPSRGLLGPGAFIPLAEETGLIVPLGRWVLDEACRQMRAWHEAGVCTPPLTMSVNVAAGQLRSSALLVDVARALAATGIPAGRLQLEITESAAMADAAATVVVLQELKDLGVRLALDDFGTGYSSLAYLRRFPVDALKIDRAFVDGLGEVAAHGAEDEAIVEVVLGVARALRLEVTAEGVETAAQLTRLRALGCALAQGYLFARPLAAAELAPLLRTGTVPGANRRMTATVGR